MEILKNKKGIPAETGSIDNLPSKEVEPDMVILLHIVEHLLDIKKSLLEFAKQIDDTTMVLVEVPDTSRYFEFSREKPLSFLYFQHLIHFNQIQLDNLFKSIGFKKIDNGKRERNEKEFVMPCIWAVYRKDIKVRNNYEVDFTLAEQVNEWFATTTLDPVGIISDLARSKKPVYVWGMGIHAWMMLGMSPLKKCNIKGLLDNNTKLHGKSIRGINIESSDLLRFAAPEDAVVITTQVHRSSMVSFLRHEIGFSGDIITI